MALTFLTLPPIFIQPTCLPLHARTPSGSWLRCTGYRRATARKIGPVSWVFEGDWVGPSACDLSETLTHTDVENLLRQAHLIPQLITLELTELELGQPSEGPLIQLLHNHWTSERRLHRDVPVEVECRLCPVNLLTRDRPTMRKRQYSQLEMDSPTSSSSSDGNAPIKSWTPMTQLGTRQVAPVQCTVDKRTCQPVVYLLEHGTLIVDQDRVSFQLEKVTLWSTEKAKFCQWLAQQALSGEVAVTLVLAQ